MQLQEMSCASYDEGPYHLVTTLYKGCGASCAEENIMMRCDTFGCEGQVVQTFDQGPGRSCGCP